MKSVMKICSFVLLASLLLWGCKKDETRAILNTGAAPTLAASQPNLVLEQSKAGDTAVTFSWGAVDYGFNDAIGYSLQISKGGTAFASATTTEIAVSKADLKKEFKVSDLNAELNKILPTGVASPVDVRLKGNTANIFSNTVSMTVTPYKVLVLYSFPQAINVAGNFQGWTPGVAPQIVSVSNDGTYEGFIDFGATATPEFKFVKGNDWPAGDFGSAGDGKLGNGGDNLKLTNGAGIYLIRAKTTDMTWSSAKINSWGLIGDAIPVTGWDSDQDLAFDATTKTWFITLDLTGGKKIKFRANDGWDINIGDKGADGKPELGGDDIAVPADGNYTVTLDILVGGNWAYTLKKN